MKVYNAVISMDDEYEMLNDAHNEYGCDLAVLVARLKAAAEKIAPLDRWEVANHGENEFTATLGAREEGCGMRFYQARCCAVELVC